MGKYDTISVNPDTKKSLKEKKEDLRYTWEDMMAKIDELLSTYGMDGADDLEDMIKEVRNNGKSRNEKGRKRKLD